MAKKNNNSPSVSSAIKSAGAVLSQSEAKKIANETGKSVAQVVAKATEKNVGVGAKLANQVGTAASAPMGKTAQALGIFQAKPEVAQALAPMAGLTLNKGTAYYGYSTSDTPAGSTYNPIVLPRTAVTVTKTPTAPATTPAPADTNVSGQTQQWSDSVDDGSQAMVDAINATLAQNQANQELYMGMIGDLMSQMSAANAQQPQSIAPYAMTTTTNAPAQGAQMTQAITRRLKNLNTSLAIAPVETATAGTGLNIPV